MPPRQKHPALGILWERLKIDVPPDDPNGCYIYMPFAWIALFRAMFDLLDHDWIWQDDPELKRQWVQDIQFQLTCELPKEYIEREKIIFRAPIEAFDGGDLFGDCEEDCEDDMARCGNDISDLIRVEGTKFQIRVIDECGDCQWKTLFDVRTGAISEKFDDILDEAGDLIDDAFDGFGLDTIQTPERRDENIIRCVKATSLVNALWEYSAAMLAVGDGITPDIDDNSIMSLNNITEFLGGAFAGLTLLGVPAAIASELIGAASSGALLIYGINEAYDEVREWMDDVTNKQKLICHMTKVMSARNQLLGSDVAAAVNKIEDVAIELDIKVAAWLTKVMRALDIRKTSEYIGLAKVSEPCGCPDIGASADPSATPPPLAVWKATADFKIHDPSYYGFTIDFGVWESGVGIKQQILNSNTASYVWIYKGLTPNVTLERVDCHLANVIKGEFWSDPQGENYDIEGYYFRTQFNSSPLAVQPIIVPTSVKTVGFKADQLKLQFMFGYDERDPNTIPDQSGRGTITSVVVWGRGTVNSDYSSWSVETL